MTLPFSKKWLLLPGVGILAAVVVAVWISTHATVSYQFGVWRMDLDDALGNLGFFLAGVAAIWTVWLATKKAKREAGEAKREAAHAQLRIDQVEEKINGGLEKAARAHLQESEVLTAVVTRMDRFERERDDCHEQLGELKDFVIRRFDESGMGRTEDRSA